MSIATMVEAVAGFSATGNLSSNHLNAASSACSRRASTRTRSSALPPLQLGFVTAVASVSGDRSVLPVCSGLRRVSKAKVSRVATKVNMCSAQVLKPIVSEAQETVTAAGSVNQATFQKLVLESDIPVLVDFWAPWCGPCRMIAPLIDELARQYAGKLKCLKLNTDDCPDIATEYGIRSIPTVMIFVNGEKKDTVIGAVPKSTLTTTIEKYLDW